MKKLYEKNNCLVNVSSSILRHYGLPYRHPSLASLDRILDRTEKKICVVLLDGFGSAIRKRYANEAKTINRHFYRRITSVFPPTTVAATTALLTDCFPVETGWLGWTEQFPEYEKSVTMFASQFAQEPIEDTPENVKNLLPIHTILETMEQNGIRTSDIRSFSLAEPKTVSFFEEADRSIKKSDFIYAYCCEPDSSLHHYGVNGKEIPALIENLDQRMKNLAGNNKDTLFVVLADHGHLNGVNHNIDEHSDFFSLLRIPHYAGEGRAAFFYVKEGKEKEFEILARRYYGKDFYILSKKETMEKKVFGVGNPSVRLYGLLGDYLLISKGKAVFLQAKEEPKMISHHAGTSDDEIYIDISIFNR